MKIILVDDEPLALEELSYLLQDIDSVEILGRYTNPRLSLEAIRNKKPDVVFLDIEMPEIQGFELAEEIIRLDAKTRIVFATSYSEHAIRAFDLNAIDYILKPLSKDRILKTIDKINEYLQKDDRMNTKYIEQQVISRSPGRIPLWNNDRVHMVNTEDILYCSAQGNEITFVLSQGSALKSNSTLIYWENRLKSQRFFRCHKSYMVNLDRIDEIVPWFNSTFILKFKGIAEEIPVGRNFVKDFKGMLDF